MLSYLKLKNSKLVIQAALNNDSSKINIYITKFIENKYKSVKNIICRVIFTNMIRKRRKREELVKKGTFIKW